jgi:HD-GYP domain-containing protein (c-di-GMP phosphodiesterase class II)
LSGITISEILSALSAALDVVEGQPEGHAVRTSLIASRIGAMMGLDGEWTTRLHYAALLKDAGCSNNSARVQKIFGGDEHLSKQAVKYVDWSSPTESLKFAMSNTERGNGIGAKLRRIVSNIAPPGQIMDEVTSARCSRGAEIALMLGFDLQTSHAIYALDEHWDGRGSPQHLRGEQIPLLARILCLAQTMEIFVSAFGVTATMTMVEERTGKWFDPEAALAALALESDAELWSNHAELLEQGACFISLVDSGAATDADIDEICMAFAMIVDAKSSFTGEHSTRVTGYALDLARFFGFDAERRTTLRRAALLHDIGKLGVPNSILDKPGKLTVDEFDRVKLHPLHTETILGRVRGFERINEIAAAHHERLDGRGYHRGVGASELDLDMRILAAADVFDALCAERPYRGAMPVEKAISIMREDAGAHLDADCVEALAEIHGAGRALRAA